MIIIFLDLVPMPPTYPPNFQTVNIHQHPLTYPPHHPTITQPSRQAALEKSQQVSEVRQQLDQLIEAEASQRQQLLGRARLQLSGWLEKAEEEGLEGLEAEETEDGAG